MNFYGVKEEKMHCGDESACVTPANIFYLEISLLFTNFTLNDQWTERQWKIITTIKLNEYWNIIMNIELDLNIPRKVSSIDCRSHDLMRHHWQVQGPWRHGMARPHENIIVLMEFAMVWTSI